MDSHINQRNPNGKPTDPPRDTDFNDTNKLDLRNEIQQQYRSNPVPWTAWVFDSINLPDSLPRNSRVLDLGSGTGLLWQENAARIPKKWEILISDFSLEMAQKAQENVSPLHQDTRFLNLDGQALPFPDESVDAILAVGLLDLVPDLDRALSEAWRVLRPSGQLIATAGAKGHLQELEDLLRPFLPPGVAESLGGNEEHFGLENGEALLAHYFEEVVRHDYPDQLVFTELEPILDYVLSEQVIAWSIPLSSLGEFVERVKRKLKLHGRLVVSIRKGLFVARKKVISE